MNRIGIHTLLYGHKAKTIIHKGALLLETTPISTLSAVDRESAGGTRRAEVQVHKTAPEHVKGV